MRLFMTRYRSMFIVALVVLLGVFLLLMASKYMQKEEVIEIVEEIIPRDVSGEIKIREDCSKEVGKLTFEDKEADDRLNTFRSLTDYKVFKYYECLEENGLEP